eukprot:767216-Hanusia_phi.AAC.3
MARVENHMRRGAVNVIMAVKTPQICSPASLNRTCSRLTTHDLIILGEPRERLAHVDGCDAVAVPQCEVPAPPHPLHHHQHGNGSRRRRPLLLVTNVHPTDVACCVELEADSGQEGIVV